MTPVLPGSALPACNSRLTQCWSYLDDACLHSPVQIAAKKGHKAILRILAPLTDNLNEPDPDGWTPFKLALERENTEIMKILAPLTANPNAPDDKGWTPIQSASRFRYKKDNSNKEIIKMLAPLVDNPNAPDPYGWTPLQRASKNGELEIIKILVPLSDNVNYPDPDGWTPLQRATKDGKLEIMKLLSPSAKNLKTPDPEGLTPIQRALKRKRESDNTWNFVESISLNQDDNVTIEQKQLQKDKLNQSSVCSAAKKVKHDPPMPKECIPCNIILKDSSKVVSHWLENETCFKAYKGSLTSLEAR